MLIPERFRIVRAMMEDMGLREEVEDVESFMFLNVVNLNHDREIHRLFMENIIKEVGRACSRRNGFWKMDKPDTVQQHWLFQTGKKLKMEAVNCFVCGNYTQTRSGTGRVFCHC